MKIKYLIDTILSPKIQPLDFVDRYAGIVRTINIAEGNGTETGIIKRYPLACDVTGVDCANVGIYQNLVPDDTKKSVIYWEMISPMSNMGMTKTKDFYRKKFKGTARLVVWLNLAKLGIDNCTDSILVLPILEKEITTRGKILGGIYEGDLLWIEPLRMVNQDINTIFGKYDYNKLKNYYLYPFDFFAIDVQFTMEQCLSKGGTFPALPALDCVNDPPNEICYIGSTYSTPFDGVNSYVITKESIIQYNLEGNQKFSFDFYIKPDVLQEGDIINKFAGYTATSSKGYFVRLTAAGEIRVGMHNDTNRIDVKTPAVIVAAVWQHITITNDSSATAAGVKIYIDGILQVNTVVQDNLTGTINNTIEVLKIGANITNARYFSGLIDDVKIYNIELDSNQAFCPTNINPNTLIFYNKMGELSLFGFVNRHYPDETGLTFGYSSQNMGIADISTDTIN
jgi:hypothetical protein